MGNFRWFCNTIRAEVSCAKVLKMALKSVLDDSGALIPGHVQMDPGLCECVEDEVLYAKAICKNRTGRDLVRARMKHYAQVSEYRDDDVSLRYVYRDWMATGGGCYSARKRMRSG